MLGIRNMREQAFLTAAVQNIKRILSFFFFIFKTHHCKNGGFVSKLRGGFESRPFVCFFGAEDYRSLTPLILISL